MATDTSTDGTTVDLAIQGGVQQMIITIEGTAAEGQTLTADVTDIVPGVSLTYQWLVGDQATIDNIFATYDPAFCGVDTICAAEQWQSRASALQAAGIQTVSTDSTYVVTHEAIGQEVVVIVTTGSIAFSAFAETQVIDHTLTTLLAHDTGVSSNDSITYDPTVSGDSNPNAVVHFIVDGSSIATTATADASGAWSFTPTGLTDGQHTVVASETDAAGNSGSASLTFMLDTIAPATMERLASDTGSLSTDKVTSNASLTGSGDPSGVVHFTVDGTAITAPATADAGGKWSFTPTGLADGSHTIVASETDTAGNTGSASLTFTLDTTAPSLSIAGETVGANKVTLTGSASDPSDPISVYDNGALAGTTVSASDDTWTFTTGKLSNSAHVFTTSATDSAGNVGQGGNEFVLGSSKADVISGTSGNDILMGNGGNDVIAGAGGADLISGGSGKVTFSYSAASDSAPAAHDTITDFSAKSDIIDFTNIAGINASKNIAQFQGNITGTSNLTLNAHSVAYLEMNGITEVLVNTTGIAETVTTADTHAANMEIDLVGVGLKLTASDFHHV